jgi:hypothetical protein
MEYPYPPEFPQKSRALVLAESIRAARDFDEAKQQARFLSAIEGPLRNYILRVFIVFVREAGELGRQRLWTVDRVESESREFLRQYTICARYEKGGDRSGNRLGEMVSNWGGDILPEIQRAFEQSPEWKEYEDILLTLTEAEVDPGTEGYRLVVHCGSAGETRPRADGTDADLGQGRDRRVDRGCRAWPRAASSVPSTGQTKCRAPL